MKSKLLFAAVLVLLTAPTALHAQYYGPGWYGWDRTCHAYFDFTACASLQIQTVPDITGGTLLTVRTSYDGSSGGVDFGGDQWLYFYSASVPEGPVWGVLPFGTGWRWNVYPRSIDLPFTVRETDLIGYVEYDLEDIDIPAIRGSEYAFGLSDPQYITPEPATIALLGTGLLGIAGVGWRRRKKGQNVDA